MYCILKIPEQEQAYLCERNTEGVLRIWDREGREVAACCAPITLTVVSELVRNHQVASLAQHGDWQSQNLCPPEPRLGGSLAALRLVLLSLVTLAFLWQAQPRTDLTRQQMASPTPQEPRATPR